ncbi:MAG TPA: uroporphyrinogen decarboxylase [Chloroflexota bacterium]|jgi:uroporphyrinogen decarboxylase|nr:uroporphyrinogen decarboxylase [Chloroflexota bacterium]
MIETAVTSGRLMRALSREPVDRTPVWFMRQAGRALPEYRAIREHKTLLEICREPDLCAEVTLQPVQSLGVDAAIIFADIMTPLIGIGIDIDIVDGVGPVVGHPIREASSVQKLRDIEPEEDVPEMLAAIGMVRRELDRSGDAALIGFSGAPFTLASYLIEGRASRDFRHTKLMMYSQTEVWAQLMERLARMVTAYLLAQIEAGADAVQLFDSWAGALSPSDYVRFVRPYSRDVLEALEACGVPIIHFSTGTAGFLEAVAAAGGTTVGVDWRIGLGDAWSRIGFDRGIQGNLDPMLLLGPIDELEAGARAVLDQAAGRPGHVFNLGHGVHPETPVANLQRLVELVHGYQHSVDAGPRFP